MTTIYGKALDSIEIYVDGKRIAEIELHNKNLQIEFKDGTVILIGYPKSPLAVCGFEIEKSGKAWRNFRVDRKDVAEFPYFMFEIASDVKRAIYKKCKYDTSSVDVSKIRAGYMGQTVIGDWED